MISISELQKQVFKVAVEHGWWPILTVGRYVADVYYREVNETFFDNRKPVETWQSIDIGLVNIPEKLCLMHEEISEALGEFRNGRKLDIYFGEDGKPEGLVVELADCVIRIMDFCGAYNLNLEAALIRKHEYNKTRPFRHGDKEC